MIGPTIRLLGIFRKISEQVWTSRVATDLKVIKILQSDVGRLEQGKRNR
jgi:hypothetical protein